jgi:hypothetical protein
MAYTIGQSVVIEVEIKEYTPYGSYAYADPASGATIAITNSSGTSIVSATALTKSAVGKYYYIWQTVVGTHSVGSYTATIAVDDTTYDGRKIERIIDLV